MTKKRKDKWTQMDPFPSWSPAPYFSSPSSFLLPWLFPPLKKNLLQILHRSSGGILAAMPCQSILEPCTNRGSRIRRRIRRREVGRRSLWQTSARISYSKTLSNTDTEAFHKIVTCLSSHPPPPRFLTHGAKLTGTSATNVDYKKNVASRLPACWVETQREGGGVPLGSESLQAVIKKALVPERPHPPPEIGVVAMLLSGEDREGKGAGRGGVSLPPLKKLENTSETKVPGEIFCRKMNSNLNDFY